MDERIAVIRELKCRLVRQHFGLQREMERLQNVVAPWYLFPGTQTRPRVLGLWGMTGTGKSTLVRALVHELGLEDITFWLDAGESHQNYWIDQLFGRLEEHLNGKPFVVVVDEFQHARMRDAKKAEPADLRRFWEFLDSGRVVTWPNVYHLTTLMDLHDRIEAALKAGVQVLQGRVTQGREQYAELVLRHFCNGKVPDTADAIPADEMETLRNAFAEPRPSMPALESMVAELDGPGILSLLRRLRITAQRPHVVDARQALVIVVGNLDELYHTGKEPLAELHPDVLVRRHEDIGTQGVHHALLRMFRIEQVARLGTDHVIFPPISRAIIERIVGHEVEALLGRLAAACSCELHVDAPVIERIGRTAGPTVMGARPVVEAVQRTVPALFAQVLTQHADVQWIELMMEHDQPVAKVNDRERIGLHWPVQEKEDRQRVAEIERTAVHEAGHALCGRILCGMRPLQVCAHTRDVEVRGFVVWEKEEAPVLRKEIVPHLARMLGGVAAEQWKYGSDAISDGSGRDLRQATGFALNMVKQLGMGRDRIFHVDHPGSEGSDGLRSGIEAVDAEVRAWMEQAERLALDTIEAHADVMDRLVRVLVEQRSLALGELEGVWESRECESGVRVNADPVASVSRECE